MHAASINTHSKSQSSTQHRTCTAHHEVAACAMPLRRKACTPNDSIASSPRYRTRFNDVDGHRICTDLCDESARVSGVEQRAQGGECITWVNILYLLPRVIQLMFSSLGSCDTRLPRLRLSRCTSCQDARERETRREKTSPPPHLTLLSPHCAQVSPWISCVDFGFRPCT